MPRGDSEKTNAHLDEGRLFKGDSDTDHGRHGSGAIRVRTWSRWPARPRADSDWVVLGNASCDRGRRRLLARYRRPAQCQHGASSLAQANALLSADAVFHAVYCPWRDLLKEQPSAGERFAHQRQPLRAQRSGYGGRGLNQGRPAVCGRVGRAHPARGPSAAAPRRGLATGQYAGPRSCTSALAEAAPRRGLATRWRCQSWEWRQSWERKLGVAALHRRWS